MPRLTFPAKAYRGAKKFVKKRYGLNKKSKGLKYGNIAKDVLMLKKMVNAEKKIYEVKDTTSLSTGQVYGNVTGTICYDITPLIGQGVTQSTRTGASIKLSSALYQFQFQQQLNATIANKVIIEFWVNKGTQLDSATAREYLFAPSTFSVVIDYNSPRNSDRFSDFQLVRRIYKTIPADANPGDTAQSTFDIPIKFNRGQGHHVRLAQSATTYADILNGQMFMTIRSQVGNNSSIASTKDVPVTGALTGLSVRFAYKTWYYDN